MVQIKTIDEYKNIEESNFGFLIIPNSHNEMIIHGSSCNILGADDYIVQRENSPESINLHWFSTIALAEKKFKQIKTCEICNPQ